MEAKSIVLMSKQLTEAFSWVKGIKTAQEYEQAMVLSSELMRDKEENPFLTQITDVLLAAIQNYEDKI